MREVRGQLLNRPVEARERVVVLAVGGSPFGFERRQIVRAARHVQRPTSPSTGLLAFAYSFRGMRPDM